MKNIDCSKKRFINNPTCRKSGDATFNLIIPKKDNSGKPIAESKLRPYISKVNKIFGGSTTIPTVVGCYDKESNGKKVFFCEKNFQIMAGRDFNSIYNEKLSKLSDEERKKQVEKDYLYLQSLARKASKELGQDSIFVSVSSAIDISTVKRQKTWKPSLKESSYSNDETVFLDKIED